MLRDLSIGFRSALAFGIIGLLVVIVGATGLVKLNQLSDEFIVIVDHRSPALSTIKEIQSQFYKLRLENANILQADKSNQSQFIERYNAAQRTLNNDINKMNSLAEAAEARQLLEKIQGNIERFYTLQVSQMALLNSGQLAQAVAMQNDEMKTVRELTSKLIIELEAFQVRRIEDSKVVARDVISSSLWTIAIIIVIAIVCVILFASIFTKMLVQPMHIAVSAAEGISQGKLNQRIDDESRDETGVMLRTLKQMQSLLGQTIKEIQSSARQLATTSEELSTVTHQSTYAIQSQNEQLEQAASAVTQMTASIEEVARNAEATSRDAHDSEQLSIQGMQKVERSMNMITNLLSSLQTCVTGLEKLSSDVQNIGSVLDVIRAIAEQTNLLALNAAIEAARAGESGRGFAVVADEVRALAHRTQVSTEEIEQMIKTLREGSSATVDIINRSYSEAQETQNVAREAGEALTQITSSISRINEKTLAVASATEQQANVSREVDRNILKIKDVSSDISNGADHTKMSSEELAKLAENLNELTNQFQV